MQAEKPFLDSFLGGVTRSCFYAVVAGSVIVLVMGHGFWLGGMWSSFGWLALNSFLVHRLLAALIGRVAIPKGRVWVLVFIKFGVLYALGLWLFFSPYIAVNGILVGFTLYFVAAVWTGIQFNRRKTN